MTISATVICDSISKEGKRLTTFLLRYPRFIHAEVMTHRVFSRNASSSRAIPVKKMIEDLKRDPAMPVYWGSNKPGMQAGEELSGDELQQVQHWWLSAMHQAIGHAQHMIDNGLHKQIANRILEPWAHINVVVTATDYENFFALRRHKDAQPEIKALADAMWDAREASLPNLLLPGDWHLPFITTADRRDANHGPSQSPDTGALIRISVARCARTSYLTHDGRETTWEEDLALYERLVGGEPLHASPAEHQATPDLNYKADFAKPGFFKWANSDKHGNFDGWVQFRKSLAGEYVKG